MPMPNAMVATITRPSSRRNRAWLRGADRGVEARVVRQRGDAVAATRNSRGLLDRVPREAVDDAGVALVLGAQQVQQLVARLVLGAIRYWMLGRSKLATKCLASRELQPVRDLRVRWPGRGRGQRDPRDLGPALVQHRQLQVVGPEVVAPLGHAVRLVDGEQGDCAAVQQLERGARPAAARAPGTAGRARRRGSAVLDRRGVSNVLRGVEEPGPDAERGQRVDLVLHQRDQRRDDHAGALRGPAPGPGSTATCRRRSA